MGHDSIRKPRADRGMRRCTSWLGVVAVAVASLSSACSGSPTAPGVGTSETRGPGLLNLPSRPIVVPVGAAILQVWGYTLYNSHGPICEPLFGTLEGTRVNARVQVSTEGSTWVIRAEPRTGNAEIRISQTGQARLEGEVLTGSASGSVRDMTRAPGEPGREVRVGFATPTVLEGFGSSSRPWLQGTISGRIVYSDFVGGSITCPLVYWNLQPADGWIIPDP